MDKGQFQKRLGHALNVAQEGGILKTANWPLVFFFFGLAVASAGVGMITILAPTALPSEAHSGAIPCEAVNTIIAVLLHEFRWFGS